MTLTTVAALTTACVAGPTPGSPVAGTVGGSETHGRGAATTVVGRAVSVDDVGSQARVAMTDGTVLVVPVAQADQLWELLEVSPREPELPYVGGTLGPTDVERWELAPIADGEFALEVPDGAYVVCLLGGAFVMRGCGEAAVSGPTAWTVSAGEGGVEIGSEVGSEVGSD